MKVKLLAAGAVIAAIAFFGATFGGSVALAACPAGTAPYGGCAQDHTWTVSLSNTGAGATTDTTVVLGLGTSTAASAPFPTPFFNEATTDIQGLSMYAGATSANYGSQIGDIHFDIQTNIDTTLLASNNINLTTGQPPVCGAAGTLHVSVTSAQTPILAADKTSTDPTVSSDPDPLNPPYTYDQEPDLANGGVPAGVTHPLDWYGPLLTQIGVPDSIVNRGYAIAKTTAASQSTVSFLNISLGGGVYKQVTVIGNPIAVFNPAGQTNVTCPPFTSTVHNDGNGITHNWNCTTDYFGNALVGCSGSLAGTGEANEISVAGTAGNQYNFAIALSSGLNNDGDSTTGGIPLWGTWDNCALDSNPSQSDANSNGIGDACKNGGSLWTNVSATAVTNAGVTCAPGAATSAAPFAPCQDADQDGVLNSVDNCPLTANSTQTASLSDGIGDACHPATGGVYGDGVGYPTEYAAQDQCNQPFTVGTGMDASYCVSATMGIPYVDSNYNDAPDFLAQYVGDGVTYYCQQDHISESRHDGYSDADHGTPNGATLSTDCPTVNPTATDAVYPSGGGLGDNAQLTTCPGRNDTATATTAQAAAAKIAHADVDLNGRVNILDLSAAASAYNQSGFGLDPSDKRNEFDMDHNGRINILDLSYMAGQYNKTVPPC